MSDRPGDEHPDHVAAQLRRRHEHRAHGDYQTADTLRHDLEQQGWQIEDQATAAGSTSWTTWHGRSRSEHVYVDHPDGSGSHAIRHSQLVLRDPRT